MIEDYGHSINDWLLVGIVMFAAIFMAIDYAIRRPKLVRKLKELEGYLWSRTLVCEKCRAHALDGLESYDVEGNEPGTEETHIGS